MRLGFIFALGVALGLVVAVTPAQARPPSETATLWSLNGEPVRPLLADGGGAGLYVADGGVGCAAVEGGHIYQVAGCSVAANICVTSTFSSSSAAYAGALATDGGCWDTVVDPNYGPHLAADTAQWIITSNGTTQVCGHPTSGATLSCAVFRMQ